MISMEYGSSQSSSANCKGKEDKALRYDLCSLLCSRCRSGSKSAKVKPNVEDTSIFAFLQQLSSYSGIDNLALFKCTTCLRRAQRNKEVLLVAMCSRCAFDHHVARSKHKLDLAYRMPKKEMRQLVREQLQQLHQKKERDSILEMAEHVMNSRRLKVQKHLPTVEDSKQ